MNELFAERFKSARMLNGMSLQDLANKLTTKISRQALHKYERGEVIPDSEMLIHLCEALNVRPDYFFRDTKVELSVPEFRKLKRLPVKEQHRIMEHTKDVLARYLELEEIIGIETKFTNPLEDWDVISSFEDIEKASIKVRKAWKLGSDPIYNTLELLEDNHIKVVTINSEDSFDGMQTWVNNNVPVIAINIARLKSTDRIRFTVLHELGHLLLPLSGVAEAQKERFCHQFAAAMLIPRETAEKELGKHRKKLFVQELGALKQQYGISIQALVYRARDLGIISDTYVKQFMYLMVHNQWKVIEPIQYTGVEESHRFNQLLFRALAEDLISMSKAAVLNNQSLIDFRKQIMVVG